LQKGWGIKDGMPATLAAQITSLSCFHQKGRHAEESQFQFQSLTHSFIHSVGQSASQPVHLLREYFYPENYLWGPDDRQPTTVDVLQFCICVYIAGIQFLFITHSAAKLFLNCPYQLRNEIYYLACVYRQCPADIFHFEYLLSVCILACLPHHYQAEHKLKLVVGFPGSSSSSSSRRGIARYFPPASSTSLVLCAVPTTFCIFT